MLTDEEKAIIEEIHLVENQQRELMKDINFILRSISNIFEEGEEDYPDLLAKNNEMKDLIVKRTQLFLSIGIIIDKPLPDNIEEHYLSTMLG